MKIRRWIPLLLLALLLVSLSSHLRAQAASPPAHPNGRPSTEGPSAEITLGSGVAVKARSYNARFELVGLRKNETVDIAIQYPASSAGTRILVVPLDGGRVIAPSDFVSIGADGVLRFKFKVEKQPGIHQVSLNNGGQEIGLQFWVRDEDPKKNPKTIND